MICMIAIHVPRMVTKCSGGTYLFKTSDIAFSRRSDLESLFPSVVSNSRTVYSLVIDLNSQFACDTVCFVSPLLFQYICSATCVIRFLVWGLFLKTDSCFMRFQL